MYFLTAVICTIIAGVLWFIFKDRKGLHLDILTVIFGAASVMWLIDCIFSATKGEPFIAFDDPIDGWISLWTLVGGVLFWLIIAFVLNNNKKEQK